MANLKLSKISARAFLNLLYTWMIDDLTSLMISRSKSRQIVDQAIDSVVADYDARTARADTWGLKPEHIAAQQRAMQMFGGA